jgi:hypothetical protein
MKASVAGYLPDFAGVGRPAADTEKIASSFRRFSPLFSNHVRLARSGGCAEMAFYTTMLSLIVDEITGRRRKSRNSSDFPLIPVALLHSDVEVHYLLVCRLLEGVDSLPIVDESDTTERK